MKLSRRKWTAEVHKAITAKKIEVVKTEMSRNGHIKFFIRRKDKQIKFIIVSGTPGDSRTIQKVKSCANRVFQQTG